MSRVTGVAKSYGLPSSVQPMNVHPLWVGSFGRATGVPSRTVRMSVFDPLPASNATVWVTGIFVQEAVSVISDVTGLAKS